MFEDYIQPTDLKQTATTPIPTLKLLIAQRIGQAPMPVVWTPVDFLDLGNRHAVDKTLQRMVASGHYVGSIAVSTINPSPMR